MHTKDKNWKILLHHGLLKELDLMDEEVEDELLAHLKVLEKFGPELGRPTVDTLKGSSFSNMKELRFTLKGGVWRFAFAFDPTRRAIVLCGANKRGKSQKVFYRELIRKADERFHKHCEEIRRSKL